jgi:hypothetical protein
VSLVFLVAAACTVGTVEGVPDPAADPGVDASADDPPVDAADVACRDAVTPVGSGEHNAGQACIACHAGNAGPDFTLAGTLYTDAAGAAPLAGATITITDANGATFDMVSQQNGNFWTAEPLAFPVHVVASRCPDTQPMSGAIAAAGDCNAGGCHASGAAQGRIHLP